MAAPRVFMFTDGTPECGATIRACMKAYGLQTVDKNVAADAEAAAIVRRVCGDLVLPVVYVNDRWLPDPTQEEFLRASGIEFDPEPLDTRGRRTFSVIVIGLGPAGLSACHGCRLAGLTVLGLDQEEPGGHLVDLAHVDDYLGVGYDDLFTGADVADNFAAHARAAGATLVKARVESVETKGLLKRVRTTEGEFWARVIVIATGATQRELDIKGVEQYIGESVRVGPTVDEQPYAGKRVCVVGATAPALHSAMLISRVAAHVTILCPEKDFAADPAVAQRAQAMKIRVIKDVKVAAVSGTPGLEQVYFSEAQEPDEQGLPIDGMVIIPGNAPKQPIPGLESLPQENGYFAHGEGGKTMLGGIYVAGDCTNMEIRTLVGVVASGSLCARRVWRWLTTSPMPRFKA